MRTDYTNITRVLIVYSASHLSLKSLPVSLSVYQVPSGRLHTSTCTVLYNGANGTTTTLTFAEARDCFLSFSRELISLSCLNEWAIPENIHTYTTDGFSDFRRGGGVYDYGILSAWGGIYVWKSEGMGGFQRWDFWRRSVQ